MSFGLLLSGVFSTETSALQAAVAAFYPAILLSGMYAHKLFSQEPGVLSIKLLYIYVPMFTLLIIHTHAGVMWPFEGMPNWLRYISAALPATYPAEAMRAVMGRGTQLV